MKILLLDNYDSFTYNLYHLCEKVSEHKIDVIRNDKISIAEALQYDKIIISPGPGLPKEAGILLDLIRSNNKNIPMLGVCLGHQGIAEAFGGSLINLNQVFHGIATPITVVADDILFEGMKKHFNVGRYHSWVVDQSTLPDCFEVTSVDDNGLIMSMKHKSLDIRSVQFHPESVLTDSGELILKNWLNS